MLRSSLKRTSSSEYSLREREIALKERELELRQAEFALRQEESKNSRWKNPMFIAILAAGVAGAANVWVSEINGENSDSLERQKFEKTVSADRKKALDASVTDLAKQLTRGYQQVSWILWKRINDPRTFDKQTIASYDNAMKEILPVVLSAHVQLATQDARLHQELAALVTDLSLLDSEVASTLARDKNPRSIASAEIRKLQSKSLRAVGSLGERISSVYLAQSTLDAELVQARRELLLGLRDPPRTFAHPH